MPGLPMGVRPLSPKWDCQYEVTFPPLSCACRDRESPAEQGFAAQSQHQAGYEGCRNDCSGPGVPSP